MTDTERFGRGAVPAASAAQECCEGSTTAHVKLCSQLMIEVHERTAAGEDVTIFDLHNATGLELARIFAVMRALEHDRIVDIRDNASDAFGDRIELRRDWQEQVVRRNAA